MKIGAGTGETGRRRAHGARGSADGSADTAGAAGASDGASSSLREAVQRGACTGSYSPPGPEHHQRRNRCWVSLVPRTDAWKGEWEGGLEDGRPQGRKLTHYPET